MLDSSAHINHIFTDGITVWEIAHHAAAEAKADKHAKSTEFVRWLPHHGIDHTIENEDGKAVLQVAEKWGHTQISNLIIS